MDQGENARIYYYLLSNNVPFIVDHLDGTIYTNDTLDREKQSFYEIIIKASNENEYLEENVNFFVWNLNSFLKFLQWIKEINFILVFIFYLQDLEGDDTSLAKVLILVTDENDNAPVFLANHYYAGKMIYILFNIHITTFLCQVTL